MPHLKESHGNVLAGKAQPDGYEIDEVVIRRERAALIFSGGKRRHEAHSRQDFVAHAERSGKLTISSLNIAYRECSHIGGADIHAPLAQPRISISHRGCLRPGGEEQAISGRYRFSRAEIRHAPLERSRKPDPEIRSPEAVVIDYQAAGQIATLDDTGRT